MDYFECIVTEIFVALDHEWLTDTPPMWTFATTWLSASVVTWSDVSPSRGVSPPNSASANHPIYDQ